MKKDHILRKLLPGVALLGLIGVNSTLAELEVMACDCDCNTWQQVSTQQGCRNECDQKWKKWQCGPYLETGIGPLDAETQRYRDELQGLGLEENEIMSLVYGFKVSSPEIRTRIWEDLEQTRNQLAEQDLSTEIAEIEAEQAMRGSNYDAETLRYKAALEQAGYSPTEVDGLVEIFSPSPEIVRKVYWDEVAGKPQNQQ